jgi:hypothetical protein
MIFIGDMMTFLLQHFVDYHCISRRQILNWYTDKNLHSYQGFDGAKQLTTPFIKLLWAGTASKATTENSCQVSDTRTVIVNPTTVVGQCDTTQIKDEPSVPTSI